MRPLVAILALLVTSLAFAGCITDEADPKPGGPDALPEEADEVETSGTTGSLTGTVSSDLFEPLGGATVSLVESGLETKVSRSGDYTLNGVGPGTYTVFFAAVGYGSMSRTAEIAAGEVTELNVQLKPLPSDEPWVDYREYVGKVAWAVSWQVEPPGVGCVIIDLPALIDPKTCSGVRGGGSVNGEVPINVSEDAKTVFSEMVWDPAGPLGEDLHLDLLCPDVPRGSGGAVLDTEHPCYFDTPSTQSPIVHRVDEAHWLEHGYNHTGDWATRVFGTYGLLGTHGTTGVDAGAAYEQSFVLYTSVFHKAPAPEDYTGIPDA